MKKYYVLRKLAILVCIFPISFLYGQERDSTGVKFRTLQAGPQYHKNFLHKFLWGEHYRKEWITPVKSPTVYLDSLLLKPYQAGGGRQSKTLRLHGPKKKEWVLRSIDKTFGRALPEIFQKTFLETIINDQVSIAHPYSSITIAPLAEAAKIYHTWPSIVYVPSQPALDTFNKDFGNTLYLLEQRPDENWEEADNFANSKKIISTEKLFEKLWESSEHRVDQLQYIRSRLFDMFIGDWGRHEDQWRWAETNFGRTGTAPTENPERRTDPGPTEETAEGNLKIYQPIPRDRDQAYTKFDGFLLKVIKSAAGIGHLQTFDHRIHNIRTYNYPARNLDRQLANETTLDQWINTAKELQQLLTDSIIESSVKLLPPEVYPLSGKEITAKLISRRNHLLRYASEYYEFLAIEVGITGTTKNDRFVISQLSNEQINLSIFDTNNNALYYSRNFSSKETNEIRIYGLDGEDVFEIKKINTPISIRIIGGPQQDQYINNNISAINIYDSKDQVIPSNKKLRLHLSNDTAIHQFKYDEFRYSKVGFGPSLFYSREDRIYLGLNYKILQNKWRREPFANKHVFFTRYSIQQHSFHAGYEGIINQFIGNWNLLLNAEYDWIRWTNFYGLGNESKNNTTDADFNRVRSRQGIASIGFNHALGKRSSITIAPFYQTVKLVNDKDRYLTKDYFRSQSEAQFTRKHFAGATLSYEFNELNDHLVPTHGFSINASVAGVKNVNESKSFANFAGNLRIYIPVFDHVVLSINNGAARVFGDPEFYQMNSIGGRLLRGYRRERFWGQMVYHNNNELQYLFKVNTWLYKGKAGIFGFADQGRVWLKGESSHTWHVGYGAGVILAPFNKVYVSVMYGMSKEPGIIHLDLRTDL